MKYLAKRFLSLLLAALMVLSMVPAAPHAHATDSGSDVGALDFGAKWTYKPGYEWLTGAFNTVEEDFIFEGNKAYDWEVSLSPTMASATCNITATIENEAGEVITKTATVDVAKTVKTVITSYQDFPELTTSATGKFKLTVTVNYNGSDLAQLVAVFGRTSATGGDQGGNEGGNQGGTQGGVGTATWTFAPTYEWLTGYFNTEATGYVYGDGQPYDWTVSIEQRKANAALTVDAVVVNADGEIVSLVQGMAVTANKNQNTVLLTAADMEGLTGELLGEFTLIFTAKYLGEPVAELVAGFARTGVAVDLPAAGTCEVWHKPGNEWIGGMFNHDDEDLVYEGDEPYDWTYTIAPTKTMPPAIDVIATIVDAEGNTVGTVNKSISSADIAKGPAKTVIISAYEFENMTRFMFGTFTFNCQIDYRGVSYAKVTATFSRTPVVYEDNVQIQEGSEWLDIKVEGQDADNWGVSACPTMQAVTAKVVAKLLNNDNEVVSEVTKEAVECGKAPAVTWLVTAADFAELPNLYGDLVLVCDVMNGEEIVARVTKNFNRSCAHAELTTIAAQEATCTTIGLTEGKQCAACGAIIEAQKTIARLNHDMQETEAEVPAACEEPGKTSVLTCANGCGKTEGGEHIEKLGHVGEPACDEFLCVRCGYAMGFPLGHEYDADKKCIRCGKYDCENGEFGAEHKWADATCTAPMTCQKCQATEGEANGHTPGSPPTCMVPQCCAVCNAELVAASGHYYVNGICEFCLQSEDETPVEPSVPSELTFTLNETGDGYIVSNCDESASGEMVIPATYNGLPVVGIGKSAFTACYDLTCIIIQEGVTIIDEWAFNACINMTNITIPDSVTNIGDHAFYACYELTSITIPDGITSIGYQMFENCNSLSSVTIPNTVTSIGDYAFSNCSSLTSITIPDGVTEIGGSAFSGCRSLTDMTIPSGILTVGGHAFSNCDSIAYNIFNQGKYLGNDENPYLLLVGVTDSSVSTFEIHPYTKIIINAFSGCTSLTNINIPDGVTCIGDYAFSGCTSLIDVTIPDAVTSIGSCAFANCTSLTSIDFGNSVISIGDIAFIECDQLQHVIIPNSVTSIGNGAFRFCDGLTSVTLPEGITTIEYETFQRCKNLQSIVIPAGVTCIGNSAFSACSNLVSVVIPDSVMSIEACAFSMCSSLTSVVFCGTQEQWDNINRRMDNDALFSATIQFHDWTEATCEAPKTCILCGTTEGETLDHTAAEAVKENEIPATIKAEGSYDKVVYCSVCGRELSRNTVVTEKLTVDTVIPDDGVSGEDGEPLTEEQQAIVQQIIEQSKQVQQALNLPDNTYLKITMSSAKMDGEKVTRVVYKVKPITDGQENSNPGQKITFYLPVPFQTAKTVASVFHNGILLGTDYEIKSKGSEKWVEVTSDNFSEFAVDLEYMDPEQGTSSAEVTVSASNSNPYRGDTVTVTVCVTETEHVYSGGFMFDYDKNVFEFVSGTALVEEFTMFGVADQNGKLAGYFAGGDLTVSGAIFQLIFKVKDTADFGEYTISGIPSLTTKIDGVKEDLSCFVNSATVTVVCNHDYSEWVKISDAQQKRTCSICGNEEVEYIEYTVTFQYADGTTIATIQYHYGDVVAAPEAPVLELGYAFAGWDKEVTVCTGDATYTAIFERVYYPGDMDGDEVTDHNDAIYLLLSTMFGEENYPLSKAPADVDGSGTVDQEDAVYLLLYTLFGKEFYPLYPAAPVSKED